MGHAQQLFASAWKYDWNGGECYRIPALNPVDLLSKDIDFS